MLTLARRGRGIHLQVIGIDEYSVFVEEQHTHWKLLTCQSHQGDLVAQHLESASQGLGRNAEQRRPLQNRLTGIQGV